MLTFNELILEKSEIQKRVDLYHNNLNSFPVHKNGLVYDIYRKSIEYIEYKKQFNFWFKKLQEINKHIVKNYKKENRDLIMQNRFKKHYNDNAKN